MFKYILNRLTERSTWLGLLALATACGATIEQALADQIIAAGMAAAGGMTGAAMALAAVLVFLRYRAVAQKQFGGISGDLAGWFLQRAELWMLAALAVSQWGGVL